MLRERDGWLGLLLIGLGLAIGGTVFFIRYGLIPMFAARAADSWTAATCTISDVEITRRVDADGKVRFDRQLAYRFEHQGRIYQGDRVDFTGVTSSAHEHMLRAGVSDPGTQTPCWFDPADPTRSVLRRDGFHHEAPLIPLVLVAAGVTSMAFANPQRTRRRTLSDDRTELVRRNASGAVVVLLGALAGTYFPMGIVIASTDSRGFLYTILGTALAVCFGYLLLRFLTEITIVHGALELRPGERLDIEARVRTPLRDLEPLMVLVGREVRERGDPGDSSPRIDVREFHRRNLAPDRRLPEDAAPSVDRGGDRVEWTIELTANIPRWPHFALDLPLTIREPT